MSHCHQQQFVALALDALLKAGAHPRRILEIGSYDVQGDGGFRSILARNPTLGAAQLIGVDLIEGPGVDYVVTAREDRYLEGSFDLAVSCEALEHDSNWRSTLLAIRHSLSESGWLIITTAGHYRPEHGTLRSGSFQSPGTQEIGSNYYGNFSRDDLSEGLAAAGFASYLVFENAEVWDCYAIASVSPRQLEEFQELDSGIRCKLSRGQLLHRLPLKFLQRLLTEKSYQVFACRYWFWTSRLLSRFR